MRFNLTRFINGSILLAVAGLTLSGVYGLFWTLNGWIFDLHRWLGWLLIAVIPWKTSISLRSLRRGLLPNFDRGFIPVISLSLSGLALLALTLGLTWTWRLGPSELWLRQTAISWHWMLGFSLLPPFLLHAWRRWPRPRKADYLSRRGALKLLGLGTAALLGWRLAEAAAGRRMPAEAPRRFTGSRQDGYFSGNRFPVTNGIGEGDQPVEIESWRLRLEGKVERPISFTYNELLALPASEIVASLDCTLGWYTTQVWRGVALRDLLQVCLAASNAVGVRLGSTTGYTHLLPIGEAQDVLLATQVGGEKLEHRHGFPLRAVVPSRRGWFWVKWIEKIEVVAL